MHCDAFPSLSLKLSPSLRARAGGALLRLPDISGDLRLQRNILESNICHEFMTFIQ